MPAATVTITDTTKGPFNLYNVLAGVQTAGVTVGQTYPAIGRSAQRRSLQASYLNGGTKLYVGADGSVSTTNGREMVAGDQYDVNSDMEDVSLTECWFTAGANGAILNADVE